jgi:hypothetical protein
MLGKCEITLPNRGDIDHRTGVAIPVEPRESQTSIRELRDSFIFGRALSSGHDRTKERLTRDEVGRIRF